MYILNAHLYEAIRRQECTHGKLPAPDHYGKGNFTASVNLPFPHSVRIQYKQRVPGSHGGMTNFTSNATDSEDEALFLNAKGTGNEKERSGKTPQRREKCLPKKACYQFSSLMFHLLTIPGYWRHWKGRNLRARCGCCHPFT